MSSSREIVIVVGTRPEIIKMAPVVRALDAHAAFRPTLVHTDQHYDDELSDDFFDVLSLPTPDAHLGVGSASHADQTADGLVGIANEIRERDPAAVLAQGDTNAVLSTALAASKLPVAFGHIEAGIRSFDHSMPEETNRVLADRVADLAFAPTETAAENLAAEGITEEVVVTGNTVVDACLDHVSVATRESNVLDRLGLDTDGYAVATIHRERNTDDPARLHQIVTALDAQSFSVVLPAHPRTTEALDRLGWEPSGALRLIDPLDYLDFLRLLSAASVAITDSGGLQEEASVLEVPCLTVRPNTERPETVAAGVNELVAPSDLDDRLSAVYADPDPMTGATDLYGDGTAAQQVVAALAQRLASDS
jgi:UDP-N-acetylglucosamine 2-epimerase (non-hydrolysing)